jgi:hypothetical protein
MGLAPNIPLSVNPPAPQPGPLDMAQKGLNVQALIQAVQQQKIQQATSQLQQQQEQIKTQQMQQYQADDQKFRQAFMDNGGDWDKTIANAPKVGVGPDYLVNSQLARTDQLTKLAALNKDQLANEASKQEQIGISAQKVLDADPVANPQQAAQVYAQERNTHLVSGAYKPTDIPEQMPSVDTLKELAVHSKANQDMLKEALALQEQKAKLPGEQAEATAKQYATGAQTMGGAQDQLSWTARRNLAVKNDPTMDGLIPQTYSPQTAEQVRQLGIAPKDLATMAPDKLELQDYLKKNPGKGPADFLAWKTGQESAARSAADMSVLDALNRKSQQNGRTVAPGLTPEATDSASTTFHNTGQLPPIGRGAAGQAQRTAIMNRERELFPGTVLSANSAEFAANKKSLQEIQPKLDQVNAFENTSLKNLDLFTGIAQKAIDSGLPIANAPLRAAAGMLGSQDQAAFNAARQVAVNEIAKVTSSPGLSGQLSDSARHEVEQFIPASATVGQIMRVASVLKQDMENRRGAYIDQIKAIQDRLGGASQQQEDTNKSKPASHPFFDQFGGTVRPNP